MKIKTTLLIAFAVSLVAAPQAFAGPGALVRATAEAACRAERAALGARDFRATYGQRPVRACVRAQSSAARQAVRDAAADCRAEYQADPDAFRDKYGENENRRNAFGMCVSRGARNEMREEVRETVNAAKACRAELAELGAQEFRNQYGTNPNGANAFGKCVSAKEQAAEEAEEEQGGSEDPPAEPPAPAP